MKFNFTSSEKNGLVALLIIIMVLQIAIFFVKRQLNSQNTIALSEKERELFKNELDSLVDVYELKNPKSDYSEIEFFDFDPNVISTTGLIELGFSKQVAKTMVNFREKIGAFKEKSDLYKIYGVDSSLVDQLLPHVKINFPEPEPIKKDDEIGKNVPDSLFNFDLNTVVYAELLKLGFSDRTAHTFINYRNVIGKFKKKEQLKSVYGISDAFYEKLSPYILFPTINLKDSIVVEINSAMATDFEKLRGIGEVLSNRIIKYRNYLGGFYSVDQLQNVYGLSDEVYNNIKKRLIVNKNLIKKINVNFAREDELKKLPGCSRELAVEIIELRSQKGAFTNINQVKIVVGEEVFYVLKNYLDVK